MVDVVVPRAGVHPPIVILGVDFLHGTERPPTRSTAVVFRTVSVGALGVLAAILRVRSALNLGLGAHRLSSWHCSQRTRLG
jgi:hypothetical protein